MSRLVAVALLGGMVPLAGAAQVQQPIGFTVDGKVVGVAGNFLIFTDDDREHEHTLPTILHETKVILDGKEAALDELKAGTPVRVSCQRFGPNMFITRIEARVHGFK
jgi:hypothetical protein